MLRSHAHVDEKYSEKAVFDYREGKSRLLFRALGASVTAGKRSILAHSGEDFTVLSH